EVYGWIRGEHSTIGAGAKLVDGAWMTGFALRKKREEEEAAAKKAAEEAAAKKAAEEAAARKAAQEAEAARLAAEEAAKSKRVDDDYLPCEEYKGEEGFHRFFRADRKEYYFSYNGNGPKTLLRSEGYTQEKARENGINSVIKNAPLDERWGTATALNDKYHYYYLRAGNNQEIARSCYYDNAAAMQADYDWVRGENSTLGKGAQLVDGVWMSAFAIRKREEEAAAKKAAEEAAAKKAAEEAEAARLAAIEAAKPQKIVDDYLPCEDYKGEAGFHKFFREDRKEYYFAYNDDKGNTLLRSEGYTTAAARDNGIESVIKNAPEEKRWKKDTALNGKYHFYALRAGNNQEIARSCYYDSEAAMLADFDWVTGDRSTIGKGAMLVGGAWMSAYAFGMMEAEKKAAAPPPPPEPVPVADKDDDYLPCGEYRGRKVNDKQNNVSLFKHENGQFYFAIYNADGSVRLRSEGFPDAKKRDEELSGALKFLNDEEMYSMVTKDFRKGTYMMKVLRDKTGREVGRSCLEKEEPAMAAAPIVEDREDDYLVCKQYRDRKINDKQNNVALFKHKNGKYYFAIYNDNGKVRLRSEGFVTAEERDVELSGALKNIDKKEMYKTIERGNVEIKVLYDKTGREVGRSCPKKKVVAAAVPAAAAAGAAALAGAAATPVKEKPVAAAAGAAGAAGEAAAGGGLGWLPWLLGLLALAALLIFLLRGCGGCGDTAVVAPPVETPAAPDPEPEEPEIDANATADNEAGGEVEETTPPPPPAPVAATCDCNSSNDPVFNLNKSNPKTLTRLGTNPEFGNSHSLSPAEFYQKLQSRYNTSGVDKRFLDRIFKEMGYSGGFGDANAGLFSNTTIPSGTVGNMGYGERHRTTYARLSPTSNRDLQAFKIEAANGCDLNFMKTCGNHFFFCPN
ncbi:MAG: YegP family protein, partial [Bacteroidota bacterium]